MNLSLALLVRMVLLVLFMLLNGCVVTTNHTNHRYTNNESVSEWAKSPLARSGKIFLNGTIDMAKATEISQKLLVLDSEENVGRITLYINSGGGYGDAFLEIVNTMKSLGKPVDTFNQGVCSSAAAGVFQAATGRRLAYKNSVFMVHAFRNSNGVSGEEADRMTKYLNQRYAELLKEKTELPDGWFPLTDKGRYFTASKALQYRFVDEIVQGKGSELASQAKHPEPVDEL